MYRLESRLVDSVGRVCTLEDDNADNGRQLSSLQDDLDSTKSQLAAANQALHSKVGASSSGTFAMFSATTVVVSVKRCHCCKVSGIQLNRLLLLLWCDMLFAHVCSEAS